MSTELHVESVVRGHHIYKSVWTLVIGEDFTVEQECGNKHDRYAICGKKSDTIVGHMPRSLSCIAWFFSTSE